MQHYLQVLEKILNNSIKLLPSECTTLYEQLTRTVVSISREFDHEGIFFIIEQISLLVHYFLLWWRLTNGKSYNLIFNQLTVRIPKEDCSRGGLKFCLLILFFVTHHIQCIYITYFFLNFKSSLYYKYITFLFVMIWRASMNLFGTILRSIKIWYYKRSREWTMESFNKHIALNFSWWKEVIYIWYPISYNGYQK